ncbi:arsenate reductase/protein-tyrosine-phosphatase family protein [Mesobacillus boroniphilus]|uniref:arsenate reductase/protein-tyrosine-phosphatase family protein n=1 Tax=Mesobacillus boroniphilus TaxID=308892 RepID=UPI00131F1C10
MARILFVCTGNTCRSPMAEAILKSKQLSGVEVKSAGVYAQMVRRLLSTRRPCSRKTISAMIIAPRR